MSGDDPFARARKALESAREARGAEEEDALPEVPSIDPRDPMAAAAAALERARVAKEAASQPRATAADYDAQRQLARLKQASGGRPAQVQAEADDEADAETEEGPQPRPRRL